MTETFHAGPGLGRLSDVTVIHGDCLEAMAELAADSVDAIVTDPPYGLGFMGKAWDELPPGLDWAKQCLRVLKPGGHLLAFGGTRTWHRLAVAVEDAGFKIRDSIAWLYGSGFPKSLDVSKAIDKAAGATREVVGIDQRYVGMSEAAKRAQGATTHEYSAGWVGDPSQITAPATPEAEQWSGWGTALKPAFEPVVVARKPIVGTVAANVLAHGTGALNIDATRIHSAGSEGKAYTVKRLKPGATLNKTGGNWRPDAETELPWESGREYQGQTKDGRWPANVVLDADQAAALDEQSGPLHTQNPLTRAKGRTGWSPASTQHTRLDTANPHGGLSEKGTGASRFFYVAKAPKKERPTYEKDGAGTGRVTGLGGKVRQCNVCETRAIESGASSPSCGHNDFRWEEPTTDKPNTVSHPTVKPLALMRWLVRLVTPPGGVVLDPFTGSGTTVEAALLEGFRVIGVEREADYLPMIQQRIARVV